MKQVYRAIKWCLFLNKRLLKKKSFLLILLAVPMLVAGMLLVSDQDSSVLKVALYGEEKDETYETIVNSLVSTESIVEYEKMDSEQAAREAVEQGNADTAWIFAEDLTAVMSKTAQSKDVSSIVTIVQREDSMQLRLVRLKLYTAVYPEYLHALYEDFMKYTLGATELTAEEIQEYFSGVKVRNDLFQMSYMDKGETVQEANYLLAPLRGMLAVWLVLAVMAAVMYYLQDEQAGLFERVPRDGRMGIALGYQWIVALDGFIVVLLSLLFTGNFISLSREAVCLLLYVFAVTGFCNLIRVLFRKAERVGAILPILMIALMIFSPVFLDLKSMRLLQGIFPAFYYLKSLHTVAYRVEMLIFAVVTWIIGILIEKIFIRYGK